MESFDAQLTERLAAGDLDALGLLYQRYGGLVRSFLLRVEPNMSQEDADDITQDTFLTFQRNIHRYQDQGKLRSFLYGVAIRKTKAWRRKTWWRGVLRLQQGEKASGTSLHREDPEQRLAAREQLVNILNALPAAQREVLILNVVEGLSVQETAKLLDVQENAVSTRLYRARKAMKEMA
jgi:RNA polymerase sigma factor (sigma-70 family)